MRKAAFLTVFLLLATLAAPTFARGQRLLGKDAPKFSAAGRCINLPEFFRDRDDCEGYVILLLEWTIRDGSSKQLGDVQKYWAKHGSKGLCVFTVYRLKETFLQVNTYMDKNRYTFPLCMGGFYDEDNRFQKYVYEKGAFRNTVIDPAGVVRFYGTKGWQAALDTEIVPDA